MLDKRAALRTLALFATAAATLGGCSSSSSAREPRYTVIKGNEATGPTSGLAPDKEADVQLVLQQREVSTRKCYQDVLDQKQDRAFQGTVKVLISLGLDGQARDVKVTGGTLKNGEVEECLIDTLKRIEYPKLDQPGEVQYDFQFRPAY